MFDIVVRGGTVIDGTRRPRFRADIGIRGSRIVAVGDLQGAETERVIDASGRIVAPGFIDVHTHSDGWLLKTPDLLPKTRQGFTTEFLMADGISYAPVDERTAPQWFFYLRSLNGLRMDEYRGWRTLGDYMECLDQGNVQNSVLQIPYANLRTLACGFGRQAPDDFQMRQIQSEVRRGMEAGCVGLSTGLDYIAQCFATTDELVRACQPLAEYGGIYITHIRYKTGLIPALREAVEIGRRAGVPVHISHLRGLNPQTADEVLTFVDTVARNEVDFSFDVYPYQSGSTMLNSLLPYEVWEDGSLTVLAKLSDPDVRARLAEGLRAHHYDIERIRIGWVPGKENSRHQGKRLGEYIAESGLPAEDALLNLLIEERLAVLCVFDQGDDTGIFPFLQHDCYMMGSDGIYQEDGLVHPRVYGSAGRLLGPCVRDHRLFSLEDAVHKLSGHAAARFRLRDRGVLREGAFADVVVFDADTITDCATYADPRQETTGVEYVLVNGAPVIAAGEPVEFDTRALPGRVLKPQPAK